MSSHYTRKTKLRNSELIRNAKVILGQAAIELTNLLEEAHAAHKKPIVNPWLFHLILRSAQFAGKCMDYADKEELAIVDAIDKYCRPMNDHS